MADEKKAVREVKSDDGEKILEVETTGYDKVRLLRNGIVEYTYTSHPEEAGASRMSVNPYYLEDAGYIDWWND